MINDFNNLPNELKALPNWVLHNKKIPYQITGQKARPNDTSTWSSYNEALEVYKQGKYEGLGFMLENSPYIVIDLDNCKDNFGTLTTKAEEIIKLCNSYTELSLSGKGVHIFLKGKLPEGRRRNGQIEIYGRTSPRYMVMTGQIFGDKKPIRESQNIIDEIHKNYIHKEKSNNAKRLSYLLTDCSPLPDRKVIEQILQSKNSERFKKLYYDNDLTDYDNDASAGDLALCNDLAFWTCRDSSQIDRLFRNSALMRDKWDEKHRADKSTYGQMTIERAINDCESIYIGGFFENNKFLHHAFADYLIKALSICRISGTLHLYDNGIYRVCEENVIHGHILKTIPTLSHTKRREVYLYIKANLDIPAREITRPELIPFKSQIYDLENDKFINYAPDNVFLNRLPYDYKPNAKPEPFVTETISQITKGDEEIIDLIYESIGYVFFRQNNYRGAIMLYGPGGNGKSTLLNMIAQVVGAENVSSLSFHDLTERFRVIEIYAKLANIGDDCPDGYVTESAIFKKIVTGENILGEKKGQDIITFMPYVKLFFSANELPLTRDKSEALLSRLLIIPLNADFSKLKDVRLKNRKWTESEMEYFVCLAMTGLKRLIKQNGFTQPKAVVEARRAFESENNPIVEFLSVCIDVEGQPTEKIYGDYLIWSRCAGHKNTFSRKKFTREVKRLTGFETKHMRHEYFGNKPGICYVDKLLF